MIRIGNGFDIHRLTAIPEKASIPLGGVSIPCFFRIQAHSDGDVLLHALTDAMLGALALGDIGSWFPDSDPAYKNAASSDFLKKVHAETHRLGWMAKQIDSIIFLEEPKLSPHMLSIREHIATLLSMELSDVSVKAKTMEGLGAIGSRKAVAAQVVLTLSQKM